MQKALITGATSGIGLELARIMARNGHDLVLCARNKKALAQITKDLTELYEVTITYQQVDLSVPNAAHDLYEATKSEDIEILVNNAGAGYVADFFDGDITQSTAIAQLNMISLMELSYYFGRDFKAKNNGKILNVGSIVSFFPGPAQPTYYASKAFVRSLSRALAFKLRNTRVTVTALHPGVTKTAFFTSANTTERTNGADPARVAALGYKAMMRGDIEVTYGLFNKFLTNVFVRIVPYRLHAPIVNRASDV